MLTIAFVASAISLFTFVSCAVVERSSISVALHKRNPLPVNEDAVAIPSVLQATLERTVE